jgi:hypothetical protein
MQVLEYRTCWNFKWKEYTCNILKEYRNSSSELCHILYKCSDKRSLEQLTERWSNAEMKFRKLRERDWVLA